jgi:hypothetical protein
MSQWDPWLSNENIFGALGFFADVTLKRIIMAIHDLHYLWWIPAVIIYYTIYYWLSVKVNVGTDELTNEKGLSWFWIMAIYGALCPLWLIVSVISKRLFVDGIIFDQLMLVTYYATMICLGQGINFSVIQWIGVGFLFVGGVLMRL